MDYSGSTDYPSNNQIPLQDQLDNITGVVLLRDEPEHITIGKVIAWAIVLLFFVFILMWSADFFKRPYCDLTHYKYGHRRTDDYH